MSKVNKSYNKQSKFEETAVRIAYVSETTTGSINLLVDQVNQALFRVVEIINDLKRSLYTVSDPPSDGVLTVAYSYVLVNTDTNDTITLPDATLAKWKIFHIKYAAGSSSMTINPAGSETIDGASSLVVTNLYDCPKLTSDGSNWYIV